MPEVQQDRVLKGQLVVREITEAIVVFPHPGGPNRIIDGGGSRCSKRRIIASCPKMSTFPYNITKMENHTIMSSKDVGRILSARGRRSFRLCLEGVDRFVPFTGFIFDGFPDGELTALVGDGDVTAFVVD